MLKAATPTGDFAVTAVDPDPRRSRADDPSPSDTPDALSPTGRALVAAILERLDDAPADQISVADAARAVGVSSGAPYRHFKGRDTLLAHVAAVGFDRMRRRIDAAMAAHPEGSIERIVAGGCAYIAFSIENVALFHLMWGAKHLETDSDVAEVSGRRCYASFIDTLSRAMTAAGFGDRDPHAFGAPLWTMVHGYASLAIGKNPMLNADADAIAAQVEAATHAYFRGMRGG